VVSEATPRATVRLGDWIAIELAGDADTVSRVVEQLWDLHRTAGAASC
jgi:hypothetical protein